MSDHAASPSDLPRSPDDGTSQEAIPYLERGVYSEVLNIQKSQILQASMGPPEEAWERDTVCIAPLPARTFQSTATSFRGLSEPPPFDTVPVEPKVVAAKFHAPNSAPRRVTVERRRRAYEAYSIEELLLKRGINYSDPTFEAKSWLPLEPFDDTTFDDRSPQEWMALCTGADREFLPLSAKV
ncbi:hypothetical protein, conserved [Eimeria tenella]|uniref:Uncharacterized protein n=1 Tax=Eimeria tenella TaxID=5802 RepID=U6KTY6_EIMTE|nr:hypothetical protein, conserved [Eimeria tenella]CDJ41592.1 hypothetical protein, conserved [Eimeria tenella]|eukprot:XP_013232342.1 hypothetical protein, conserved [Eimeria tenella]